MDLKPFKLDIDELINDFDKGGSTTFAEFKRIWLSKKFSFIFEASPSTNQACFMQSLYTHSIGYMVSTGSLSDRVGGLYCLYCLYETQPFKPPFKIYLSLGDLKRLKNLVVDTKTRDIKVVSTLVKRMLERNVFLFGSVDANEGSATERINELTEIQNARVQAAYKMLFAKTRLEQFIHMDLGRELDVDLIKKKAAEYAVAKELSIREASKEIDVQNVKHIAENKRSIGDTVEKIAVDWNFQKESFYQQTGFGYRPAAEPPQNNEIEFFEQQHSNKKINQNEVFESIESQKGNTKFEGREHNDDFGKELEVLLSQPFESDNEETEDNEHWEEDEKLEE
ncbi:Small nuclear RNA activating complex (SNAPc) [Forsythia ovata]|uniref:Small nuclear RNA activating complex (SNAPc) n=1 Tax=Forsythia ovata TaxID=205694 RepID=A0ABD1SJZ7_9LAMI